MASKQRKIQDFSEERDILNFRPNITFIEPEQIDEPTPERIAPVTLDDIKTDTDNLISDYRNIQDLSDLAQQRIDARSAGLTIKLDPAMDAHILAAVRRHFNDPNKSDITYEDYKECLEHINKTAINNFSTSDETQPFDPFRTVFGGLGGNGRPELEKNSQAIEPLNLDSFQSQILEELLKLLGPGMTKIATDQIQKALGF
jgi:hypothetical protein